MAWDIGAVEFSIASPPPLPDVDSGGGGGGLDSFGEPILPTIPSSHRWIVLGKFFYDSETAYHAITPVQHPDYFFEARVLQWGFLDRSIPVPTGLSQVGDCRIRIADTDRKFRDKFGSVGRETPRRRFIELRWCPEGGSESEFPPFGTFEIKDMEFAAGDCTIIGRDVHFAWVFKKFPNLINRTNFPDLITGFDEAQFPVITGITVSRADNLQGVVPLPRISATRWALAAHPIHRVVAVYRRFPGEGLFSLVDSSEYTVTQDPPSFIEDIEYNLTFLDFSASQDDGTELRADVEGINFRGNFFGMPPVSGTPLRNPVDFLINLLYVMLKSETEFPAFNIQSFIDVRNKCEAIIEDSEGLHPYYCDGAITESLTCGEILSRFLTSFEMDLYCNRYGEFELNLTTESDPARPVFNDTLHIIRNSVRQRLASPTFNRLRFRFERNYAEDEWGSNEVFNNLPDQLALGKIEEDTVDQWFVRDFLTGQDVIRRRAELVALGSFRIEFDLPAPEVQNYVELSKLFGVDHYGALVPLGEYKTTGITTDLDEFKTTLRGVLRVPQFIQNIRPGASASGSGLGSGASAGSAGSFGSFGSAGAPLTFSGESYIEILDFGIGSSATSGYFYRSQFLLPISGYDVGTQYYLEFIGKNDDAVDRTWSIVQSGTSEGSSIPDGPASHSITVPAGFSGRFRDTTPFDPGVNEQWAVQIPASTSGNSCIAYRLRVVVVHSNATKLVSQFCMANRASASQIDQNIGDGDIFRTTSWGNDYDVDHPEDPQGFVSCGMPRFKWDASAWANVTEIRFFGLLANAAFASIPHKTSGIGLWDVTAGQMFAQYNMDRADMFLTARPFTQSFFPEQFTDGHIYDVMIRSKHEVGQSDFNTYFHKAELLFYVNGIEAFELYARLGDGADSITETRIKLSIPVDGPSIHHQAHAQSTGILAAVRSYGTSDISGTGTDVPATFVEITDADSLQERTANIAASLVDANRYAVAVFQGLLVTKYPGGAPTVPFTPTTMRQQYLAELYEAGYPPVIAVLFEEGTGAPTEFFTGAPLTSGGSPTWTTDGIYGTAGRASATTDYWKVDNRGLLLPTDQATLLVIRKKADGTKRDSNVAGLITDFFARWFGMNIPVSTSGGLARFNVASNDLTVAFTVSTNKEALAVKFSPAGRAIFRDGTSIASDATAVTRFASNSTDDFSINNASSNYSNGDIQDVYFVALVRGAIPDALLANFTVDHVLLGT